MELKDVVPWGRTMAEYKSMFSLNDTSLSGAVLGCGDGPASFNAQATRTGCNVTSIDPIYAFDKAAIAKRISNVRLEVMDQIRKNQADYIWKTIESPEQLEKIRLVAMEDFLSDFESGLEDGRYIPGGAPDLPFEDNEFDLALCSHFLFLYTNQLGYEKHLQCVQSLVRVATEVRIFPLSSVHNNEVSAHLKPIISELNKAKFTTEIVTVDYEFMRGATQMLVISNE